MVALIAATLEAMAISTVTSPATKFPDSRGAPWPDDMALSMKLGHNTGLICGWTQHMQSDMVDGHRSSTLAQTQHAALEPGHGVKPGTALEPTHRLKPSMQPWSQHAGSNSVCAALDLAC